MTDPITPATSARLRELLDAATSGGRGWRAVMRGDEWRIRAPHPAASSCEPSLDCENNVKAIVEVFNAIHPLLDQLAAQAAEIERVRAAMLSALSATRAKVDADISTELLCLGADEIRICIRRLERELAATVKAKQENDERFMIERDEAWWRVKELEGLLGDADHHFVELIETTWREDSDIRGDRFEDIHKRIDAALAKREGIPCQACGGLGTLDAADHGVGCPACGRVEGGL